ncbi:heat shock protein 90, partial [Striga asiatica]
MRERSETPPCISEDIIFLNVSFIQISQILNPDAFFSGLIFSIFFLSRSGMVLIETSRYTSGFNLGEPNMFADWIHRMFRLELMIDEDAREGVFLRLSRIRIRIPTSCREENIMRPFITSSEMMEKSDDVPNRQPQATNHGPRVLFLKHLLGGGFVKLIM